MLLLVLFYILFVLFFVTVVAVSRPCRLLEFYLNRPLHHMALHCFTSATTRPPTNLSLELSPSLLSWWDSGARGTFSATTQSEAIGGAARESTLTLYPTLLGAPSPKQYSTPPLIPPATQATCSSHPSTLTPHHYPHPSLTSFTPN